jgi:ABC-type Fe3+ transport system substrate-binding protein
MKQLTLISALVMLLTACQKQDALPEISIEAPAPSTSSWESLFSGDSLDNFNKIGDATWQIVDNYVESIDGEHSFLVTKNHYSDFEMHIEFWPSPDANSGVFLRCQIPNEIANETCYELNIYDLHSNPDNATGSIINLAAPLVAIQAGDRWNSFDISVRGSRIVVKLNDVTVVDFVDDSFSTGPIGLQSNGGLIRFRNVRIRLLQSDDEIWAEIVSAAEQEGSIICACPPIGSLGEFLDAEWSSEFPNITLERTSAVGDWPSRITTEREAGVYLWDTYFWASNPPVYALKNQGAFVPLIPELILAENADEAIWGGWDNAFMDKEKQYLLSFRVELGSVAFNAGQISAAEFTAIEDLLKPKYKSMISIDDPRVVGGGDVFGAWFLTEFGEDAWKSLLTEQDVLFAATKDEQAQGLARGPQYIAIPNPGAASLQRYRDAGVEMDVRNLGNDSTTAFLSIAYSTTGIFSKAPHPNAARVFTNWLLSKDIQTKLKRFAHNSRRRDVAPADPEKYPKAGVEYFYPQSEAAIAVRQTALELAKEARPN